MSILSSEILLTGTCQTCTFYHGPLTRYVTLRVAHAPGMPGTFPHHRRQRKPLVSTVVPNVCQQDDRSTLDGEKLSDIPDFLYQLKMHRKAHPTNLLSGSLNINSIRHKFPTFDYILQNGLIDIFGICETKLDNSFSEAQFHVENFIYYRKDRSASGGGVMLYVRSDIPQRRRHDLEKLVDCSESSLEIIIIEIITDSKERWMYVMGYKPPDIKTSLFVDI